MSTAITCQCGSLYWLHTNLTGQHWCYVEISNTFSNSLVFASATWQYLSLLSIKIRLWHVHMIKCTNFVLQAMNHKDQITRLPLLYSKHTEFLVSIRTANGRVGPTARTYMHTNAIVKCWESTYIWITSWNDAFDNTNFVLVPRFNHITGTSQDRNLVLVEAK